VHERRRSFLAGDVGGGVERPVIVPHEILSPEALRGLIEEFVTRPGTDTGYVRGSLRENVDAVLRQIQKGKACIVYDEKTQTANIVPREEVDKGRHG
jgi:uncharacterized protein